MRYKILSSLAVIFVGNLYSYPAYQEFQDQNLRGEGSYLSFVGRIKDEIKTVFEIGSRDAKDAIDLSKYFKCHVFAFECNPRALDICKTNIGENPNVTLMPYAVWDKSGPLSFFRVIDGNIGASSCFQFNPEARNYPDIVQEGLIQEEITVDAIRLDEFLDQQNMDGIDLICMDVQGACYEVLESLGDRLSNVKYIITELEAHPIYKGEKLFDDVDQYLKMKGFVRLSHPLTPDMLFEDVLYVRKDIYKKEHRRD